MQKLTREQALAITGYTGKLAINFVDFHGDVERRLGRPVLTHEFALPEFFEEVMELYREDFMAMIEEAGYDSVS